MPRPHRCLHQPSRRRTRQPRPPHRRYCRGSRRRGGRRRLVGATHRDGPDQDNQASPPNARHATTTSTSRRPRRPRGAARPGLAPLAHLGGLVGAAGPLAQGWRRLACAGPPAQGSRRLGRLIGEISEIGDQQSTASIRTSGESARLVTTATAQPPVALSTSGATRPSCVKPRG